MAVYPYTVLQGPPLASTPIDPGSAVVIPFQLQSGHRLNIDLIQVDRGNQVQDCTLQAWVSTAPVGDPDPSLPLFVQTWKPNKIPNTKVICVFDNSSQTSNRVYAIPAVPGGYYLNLLNLTNQPNQFWLTINDPDATS